MADWNTLTTEIVGAMTTNHSFTRIDDIIVLDDDDEVPASVIHNHYTLKCLGITAEGIRQAHIGEYLVEIKLGKEYTGKAEYDTEIKDIIDLIVDMTKKNGNFPGIVGLTDDPEFDEDFEPNRIVATINFKYGIRGC